MTFQEILTEFDTVASECRLLLETEIRHHRQHGGEPGEKVLDKKRALIERLDQLISRLREESAKMEESPSGSRDQLNLLQQKLMQVMRLDRELEKLLLTAHVKQGNPGPASDEDNQPRAAGLAARFYGKRPDGGP